MAVFLADEQTAHPVDGDRLVRLAQHVLADRGVPPAMELSILLVDAATMAELNEHHMGSSGPTDVLAFPMDMPGETPVEEPAILGDVVICPEVAAGQRSADPEAEMEVLVVHGILHLLGHDHATPPETRAMFGLTDRLLRSFRKGAA